MFSKNNLKIFKSFLLKFIIIAYLQLSEADKSIQDSLKEINVNSKHSFGSFKSNYILLDLIKVTNESSVNAICFEKLKDLEEAITQNKPWAIKALDASASLPSGFIYGQNSWLGSRQECDAIQNSPGLILSKRIPRITYESVFNEESPIDFQYRVIYIKHNSRWQIEAKIMAENVMQLGLCLPKLCSTPELQSLVELYIENGDFNRTTPFEMNANVLYSKDLEISQEFLQKVSLKIFGSLFAFTAFMVVLAFTLRQIGDEKFATLVTIVAKEKSTMHSLIDNAAVFAKCFDLRTNFDRLFSVEDKPSAITIGSVDGLRIIAALWTFFFHVFWFLYINGSNEIFSSTTMEQIFLRSGPVMVDIFFTMSGFLQTYNFLRNPIKMEALRNNTFFENFIEFFKQLFHRYMRLAPLYLIVLCMTDILYDFLGDVSVFHIYEDHHQICQKYWWRNILFTQNFLEAFDICASWTWSVACEMHYFTVSLILLIAYAKHRTLVKFSVLLLAFANLSYTFYLAYTENFEMSFVFGTRTASLFYTNPAVRILPYIIGAIAGHWLAECGSKQIVISLRLQRIIWNGMPFLGLILLPPTLDWNQFGSLYAISLVIVGRIILTLCVCWIIVTSILGYNCWWSKLLELRIFKHFSRLTYAFYLLNPFVIIFVYGYCFDKGFNAQPTVLFILGIGFFAIIYLASVISSLIFEMPYCNLSALLLKRSKSR